MKIRNKSSACKPPQMKRATHVQSKPTVRRTKENLEVLPLTKMCAEVTPAGSGSVYALDESFLVNLFVLSSCDVGDIVCRPVNVALNIHGEPRRLRNCETEEKPNDAGDASEADENTPDIVNPLKILKVGVGVIDTVRGFANAILVRRDNSQANERGSFLKAD